MLSQKRCSICKKIKIVHIRYFWHPICKSCDKGYIDKADGCFKRHNYSKIFRTTLEYKGLSEQLIKAVIIDEQNRIDREKYKMNKPEDTQSILNDD